MCITFYIKGVLNYFFGPSPNQNTLATTSTQISEQINIERINNDFNVLRKPEQSNINWSMTRVLNSEMLSDNEIYQSLSIIKEQFKYTNLKGFFDPQVFNARIFKNPNQISINPSTDTFIQIFHDGHLHWYTLTNMNAKNSRHIRIYDSYFMSKTYENNQIFTNYLKKLISIPSSVNESSEIFLLDSKSDKIKKELDMVECTIEAVQVQSDTTMCGFFSIAFVFDLCMGVDPTTQSYDESKMRAHLYECLVKKKFSQFPKNNLNFHTITPSNTIYVSI